MILSTLQLIALFATAARLATFCPNGHKYRFFVSLLATVWLGSCAALGVEMLLAWPSAVSQTNALTAMAAGASMAAAREFVRRGYKTRSVIGGFAAYRGRNLVISR